MVGEVFGHYQIIGEIGYGGMGAVYRTKDTLSSKIVAIKLLPSEYLNDLGLRASFERESRLVAALQHEAIVPVYEFGEQDSQPYFAMQYMPNGSLADRLIQGAISPGDTAHILERLSGAIDYAHVQGVIHRDIKPSNILFDEKDQPYLADFGIARPALQISQPGPLSGGTPAYLSPEQASGEENIDGRSDLYSLGVILFEMLTGKLPFEGETPLAVVLMQIHDLPPSMRAVDRHLPPALDDVIQRCLAKEPKERYSTAGELFSAFQTAIQGQGEGEVQAEEPIPAVNNEARGEAQSGTDIPVLEIGLPSQVFASADALDTAGAEASNPSPPPTGSWRGVHFLTLSLVTILGILLAAFLVAFMRNEPANGSGGILISYDSVAVNLTNGTSQPINLSGIVFRRISGDGTATASFPASRWTGLNGSTPQLLEPGACYQLLRSESALFNLKPGEKLPVPRPCRTSQGWLVASDPGWLFWVAEGDSVSFQIIVNGLLVQTCTIGSGSCKLTFSQP